MARQASAAAALIAATISASAQPAKITVQADQPGHAISPTLWGVFFEDINLSADGGIYPELVRNRSFEDAAAPADWNITGAEATIDTSRPLNPCNRRSLRLQANGAFSLANEGYWDMNIVAGEGYTLKLAARSDQFSGKLTARVLGANSNRNHAGRRESER